MLRRYTLYVRHAKTNGLSFAKYLSKAIDSNLAKILILEIIRREDLRKKVIQLFSRIQKVQNFNFHKLKIVVGDSCTNLILT